MATPAPSSYCSFDFVAGTNGEFSLCLSTFLTTSLAIACYLPNESELATVGNFLIAAVQGQKPAPVKLTQNVQGTRTLSLSATGNAVNVTLTEANISANISVDFSLITYSSQLATRAANMLDWAQ